MFGKKNKTAQKVLAQQERDILIQAKKNLDLHLETGQPLIDPVAMYDFNSMLKQMHTSKLAHDKEISKEKKI